MTDAVWKAFERTTAKFFGTTRNPLSGGNSKHSRSDTLHKTLYGENKYSKNLPLWKVYNKIIQRKTMDNHVPYIHLVPLEPVLNPDRFLIAINSNDLIVMSRLFAFEELTHGELDRTAGSMVSESNMAIINLYDDTARKALVEKKTPYLALKQKRANGWLLVFRPCHIHILAHYHEKALEDA